MSGVRKLSTGRRNLLVGTAMVLALVLLAGVSVAASLQNPRPGKLPTKFQNVRPHMPTSKGKRGKGPTAHRARGRVVRGKHDKTNSADVSPGGLLASGGTLQGYGWPAQPMPTVGKLYPAGCSGTVIGVDLVLTAAHCLYNQARCQEFAGVTFYPGMWLTSKADRSRFTSWGTWKASRWWIPYGYRCAPIGSRDDGLDWGVVEVAPGANGAEIGNVTGGWWEVWYGLNVGPGAHLYLTGYPASGSWAGADGYYGMRQYFCDVKFDGNYELLGNTFHNAWGYVVPCYMNGGVSGGPWFIYLDDLKKWVVGAVSSWCWPKTSEAGCTPTSQQLRALYLDDRFRTFMESVQRQR